MPEAYMNEECGDPKPEIPSDEFDHLSYAYYSALHDPEAWYNSARSLFGAACVVAERINALKSLREANNLGRVYRLLAGFALEALFKAIIVLNMEEVGRNTKLPLFLNTHNLVALSGRARITLDPEEIRCIDNLTVYVKWGGRYPVPTDLSQFGLFSWSGEPEIIERLFKKYSKPFDITS